MQAHWVCAGEVGLDSGACSPSLMQSTKQQGLSKSEPASFALPSLKKAESSKHQITSKFNTESWYLIVHVAKPADYSLKMVSMVTFDTQRDAKAQLFKKRYPFPCLLIHSPKANHT